MKTIQTKLMNNADFRPSRNGYTREDIANLERDHIIIFLRGHKVLLLIPRADVEEYREEYR